MVIRTELKNQIITDENFRYCEIYKITNISNQKVYIGQAVSHRHSRYRYYPSGMEKRFREHIREANNSHIMKLKYHSNALNNALLKYGFENFTLQLICNCKIEDSNRIETEEIIKHNSLIPYGYNINVSSSITLPSLQLRQKISEGNLDYHLKRHILKFEGFHFDEDESNFDKYITARTKHNKQIGWYVRLNRKIIEFVSSVDSLEKTKERAFDFLKKLRTESIIRQRDQIAGNPLEPSLPLTCGNACEDLG
jgi:hypothetical protein